MEPVTSQRFSISFCRDYRQRSNWRPEARFEERIGERVAGHASLEAIVEDVLSDLSRCGASHHNVLVESVVTPNGPRPKTICSLGNLSPRPLEEWFELAQNQGRTGRST